MGLTEMKKNVSVASIMGGSGGMGQSRHTSALFIVAILVFLGVGAGALYLSFQKSAIFDQQKQLDSEIAALNSQIADLKSQKIEAAQYAKSWIDDIEKDEIHWSSVLKSLQGLIPLEASSGKAKVRFLSYSGSTGGKLTLNAETLPSPKPPFEDVSQLVNLFNASSYFKDAYVPSISRGLSETGNVILSFIFNVTYLEEPATPSIPTVSTPSNDTSPTSAPDVSSSAIPSPTVEAPTPTANPQTSVDATSGTKIPRKTN